MGQAEGVGKGHAGGLKAELGITVAKGETLAIDRAKAENMMMGGKTHLTAHLSGSVLASFHPP